MQILYCGLLYYSRHKGISSSGVQFIFWVLHGVGEAVRFRSNILRWQENKVYIRYIFPTGLNIVIWLHNCNYFMF